MREFVVGVDAGGTQTIAALANGSEVLRVRRAAAANPLHGGNDRSVRAIVEAVEGVLDGEAAAALSVGVAGAGRPATRDVLLAALAQRFPATRVGVTDDAHVALRGAIPEGDAMVLIAGTGSIAYAEVDGRPLRAGGYGYAIGDEGSGCAIGAAALRLLLRAYEKRAPFDELCTEMAARLSVADARETLAAVYGGESPIATVAACAQLVVERASQGERSALKIVQDAALELFGLVRAIVAACEGAREGAGRRLAFAGGLLRDNTILSYLLETRIANELPHVEIVKGGEPYLGAIGDARALLA